MKEDVLDYIENSNQSELIEDISTQESSDNRVKEALKIYFSSIDSLVGEQDEVDSSKKQLDFFLSKRFLMTAYNNLKNFDPAIHDHNDITEKLKLIKKLQKAYNTTGDKDNVPELAFEMIFLRAQPEYVKFISDKERCLSHISVLKTLEESLLPEIREREAEINKLKKSDKRRTLLENEIKPIRGQYVDGVEKKAVLIEELNAMEDIKEIYTEKYYESFIDELSKLSVEYKNVLSTILDHKAGELDNLIWENAAKSKLIQEYFFDAGIEGDYSTKTYLNYYINTLDKSKMGTEQKELTKFLKYLEKIDK